MVLASEKSQEIAKSKKERVLYNFGCSFCFFLVVVFKRRLIGIQMLQQKRKESGLGYSDFKFYQKLLFLVVIEY